MTGKRMSDELDKRAVYEMIRLLNALHAERSLTPATRYEMKRCWKILEEMKNENNGSQDPKQEKSTQNQL